jgi:DNA-3-methyladenine glycosylase II
MIPAMRCDFTNPDILTHLRRQDPVLGRVIRTIGACTLVAERSPPPFAALVRAIAHQQLHGAAAQTILRRFCGLFLDGDFPAPEALAAVSDEQLRAVGFSGAKVIAIRDLAARSLDGTIPNARSIARMSDEAIVERLTQVRGVGR